MGDDGGGGDGACGASEEHGAIEQASCVKVKLVSLLLRKTSFTR